MNFYASGKTIGGNLMKYLTSGNPIVYDLKAEANAGRITVGLAAVPKYLPAGVKVTEGGAIVESTTESHQIGHRYTLTVTNLQQLGIKDGNTTLDYSGVISIAIPDGEVKDSKNNSNDGETISSLIEESFAM